MDGFHRGRHRVEGREKPRRSRWMRREKEQESNLKIPEDRCKLKLGVTSSARQRPGHVEPGERCQ